MSPLFGEVTIFGREQDNAKPTRWTWTLGWPVPRATVCCFPLWFDRKAAALISHADEVIE
jgi:hypothetical protein